MPESSPRADSGSELAESHDRTIRERERLAGIYDAIKAADAAWDRVANARDPLSHASGMISLSNAMSDLASWHPEYDSERGEIPPEEL